MSTKDRNEDGIIPAICTIVVIVCSLQYLLLAFSITYKSIYRERAPYYLVPVMGVAIYVWDKIEELPRKPK